MKEVLGYLWLFLFIALWFGTAALSVPLFAWLAQRFDGPFCMLAVVPWLLVTRFGMWWLEATAQPKAPRAS